LKFFFKKIKEKNKLNCEANIVDSLAKYISFDNWVNRKLKKKKDQIKLDCEKNIVKIFAN
jgi:hypothetical protein